MIKQTTADNPRVCGSNLSETNLLCTLLSKGDRPNMDSDLDDCKSQNIHEIWNTLREIAKAIHWFN